MLDYDDKMVIPGQTTNKLKPSNDNVIGEDPRANQAYTGFNLMLINASAALTKFLESWFGIVNAHHYFFLALLGIITASICFCTDLCTVYLIDRKKEGSILLMRSQAFSRKESRHWLSLAVLPCCCYHVGAYYGRLGHVVRAISCLNSN